MRYMYDATRSNAGALVKLNPQMVAIYLTGSSDIRWTSTEVAMFPHAEFVRIDQGGATSPQYEAHVADAEPGAWSIVNAEKEFLVHCTAPRPTVYCDRSDFKTLTANCPVWLAAPGLTDAEAIALATTDKRIVAVQNVWAGSYDRSIVIDPNWPNKAPVTPPPPPPAKEFEVQVERYQPGFGWVLEQQFNTKPGTKYRVRVSDGSWSNWQEVTI